MNNRRIGATLVLLIVFCISNALAQTGRLSFEVKDSTTRKSLVSVTCRVYSTNGKLSSYAISDKMGRLAVNANPSDAIEFSFMGYAKKELHANQCKTTTTNIVLLATEETQLKEVVVKIPPIRAKSDTLVYNVGSFTKAGDKYLEDVLKKLPGVNVSKDGSVSVQGKAINKFYIEGLDLMGNNYSQATRNMPIDAIKSVEVIENHQPVKMLGGKQMSDRAALNIKLDNNHKARLFGEIEGGAGIEPSRWDNRIFLTHIKANSQLIMSGKMNNTGTDLSAETKEHIDFTDIDAYEPLMKALLTTDVAQENITQDRYIGNKSYSAGVNWMRKLSGNSTLRLNILYYGDHSTISNESNSFYGGDNPLTISESNSYKRKTFSLMPIVKYELNSEKTFLSDELRYSLSRTTLLSHIVSRGAAIDQSAYSRPSYLQNYLNSSFRLGNLVVSAKSLLRYYDRTETLDDSCHDIALYNVQEAFASKSFVTKNLVSTSIPLLGNYLDVEAKAYYRDNCYNEMATLHRKNLKLSLLPSYYIRYGAKNGVSLALPIEYNSINLNGGDMVSRSRNYWSLSPTVTLRHEFSSNFKSTLSLSLLTSDDLAPFYSPSRCLTGYRTIFIPNNDIYRNVNKRASLSLRYRNLATMFFANIIVAYTDEKREAYNNYDYTTDYNIISTVKGDNHRRTLMAIGSADKTFTDAGIVLKTEISYTQSRYLLSQSQLLVNNHSHVAAARINAIYQKQKWLRLSLDAKGNIYWERNDISNSDALKSLVANASLSLFPTTGLEIKLKMQSHTNEISTDSYKSSTFLDGNLIYTISKRWEAGLSVSNILNSRSYIVTTNNGLNTFQSILPLRGREALVRLQLKI